MLKEILEKGHHDVDAVLAAAGGKSKREVQEVIAKLAPKPDVEDSIRELRAPKATAAAPEPEPEPATGPLSSAASRTIDLFEAVRGPNFASR